MSAIAAKKRKGPQLPACQSATRTGAFGRCPIRYPSGSPRKSATIIPFVNKTLTSGLPTGSLDKWLMKTARWLTTVAHPKGGWGGREVTGVVIGSSYDRQRVKIRWDDTGQVMHCVKNKLELSPTRNVQTGRQALARRKRTAPP